MNIIRFAAPRTISFNDLPAMLEVERRCDDLQAVVASGGLKLVQLSD